MKHFFEPGDLNLGHMTLTFKLELNIHPLDLRAKIQIQHTDTQCQNYTLPTDQPFNFEFQFKSVLNWEFQPKFGIQLGIPISMGINLRECITSVTSDMWCRYGLEKRSDNQPTGHEARDLPDFGILSMVVVRFPLMSSQWCHMNTWTVRFE